MRVALGVPVFQLTDYRLNRVIKDSLSDISEYDPVLGWRVKSGIITDGFNSIEQGIRRNRAGDDHIRQGGVLAVGASFTAGSDVRDEDAWPAQLETLIGEPVVNAGTGGFGADQIVLRAEQLIPIVRPRIIVADFTRESIVTAGFSFRARAKLYFTVENNVLTPHNLPVPTFDPSGGAWDDVKSFLGYSLAAHQLMASFFTDFWFSSEKRPYVRAGNDEVEASCALIRRLRDETWKQGIRLVLTMQYTYESITSEEKPSNEVLLLQDCVHSMGLSFIDEFDDLKALLRTDVEKLHSYYVRQDSGPYGHKSKLGNLKVAEAVRSALAKAPNAPLKTHPPLPTETAEVVELLSSADEFESLPMSRAAVTLAPVSDPAAPVPYHRLSASDPPGEHYLVINRLPTAGGGQFVAAIEVRPETTATTVRLQLLNGLSIGAYGDFDVASKTSNVGRLGIARQIGGKLESLPDGWTRIWVTANLPPTVSPASSGLMIVQLLDQGKNPSFVPAGEAIAIRAVSLTAGSNTPPERASKPLSGFTELIAAAEKLENLDLSPSFVKLQAIDNAAGKQARYQLTATGGNGEHYLVISRLPIAGGQHVASLELRPEAAGRLRLQLFDDKTNGVIGDFDFARNTRTDQGLGAGREMRTGVELLEDGWVRAWVSVKLPADAGEGAMIIQLLDSTGKPNFTPAAEAIAIRQVQLTQAR